MIFKVHHLLGIKSGKVTVAFRKWEKPAVRQGGTIRNEMGVIKVEEVRQVTLSSITERDAIRAGYHDRGELVKALDKVGKGNIFRIQLSYQSADPRIKLREQHSLTDGEFETLKKKLARLDQAAGAPWTMKYLTLIKKHPERRAGDLADMVDMERPAFKLNVRKLKNLGLTISHEIGYSVSPLGEWVMGRLD